ncbi:aquaporin [Candidatus Saccharibacteria bacterium]|nr:aquaporin [Candidatus Saccharibacteria bacterium]
MATKKTASTAKKKSTTKMSAPVAKKSTTTVKTVSASSQIGQKFNFSRSPLLAASVAEFIGTFIFAGSIMAVSGQPLFVLFALTAVVLTIGAMSGAHVNPLLTVGALVTKRISGVRAASYLVAQVFGAMMALVVMNAFFSAAPAITGQAAAFSQAPSLFKAAVIPEGKEWVVLSAELLGATVFAFTVATAMRMKEKLTAAVTVGAGLYVALLLAGSGASYVGGAAIVNPAVAGALQAVKWDLWPIMIYVLTPLVGGVLGFALNDLVTDESNAK